MKVKPLDAIRKVALYRNPKYDSMQLRDITHHQDPDNCPLGMGYVRVSEVLEVTVPPLPPEEVTAGHLRALYALKAEAQAKAAQELAVIDREIAKCRALPAPEEPVDRSTPRGAYYPL